MSLRPPIITASLLASLRSAPCPPQVWYYVTAVTLSTLNRPDEISKVLHSALKEQENTLDTSSRGIVNGGAIASGDETHGRQLDVARRMRESLVKSAAVVGLPKTINALLELKKHTPEALLDPPMTASSTGRAIELASVDSSLLLHRGEAFFSRTYGKIAARVMGQMDRSGTEDLGLLARLFYGYLLSNLRVLGPAESSWVLIAGLIPQDVNPQLKGHLRGALNNGATLEEVKAVRASVISICQASGVSTRLIAKEVRSRPSLDS